jgi:signal transduction histidine kinase
VSIYYKHTYNITISSLNKNLRDVAKLGKTLFDVESIEAIKRLKKAVISERRLSDEDIAAVLNGEMRNSLPNEAIDKLQSSDDFLLIMRKLVTIGLSSLHDTSVTVDNYDPEEIFDYLNNGVIGPFLIITLDNERDLVQTIVSPAYKPIKGLWSGNPIGNTYATRVPLSTLKKPNVYVHNKPLKDSYYTFLFSSVPIYDSEGNFLAILELDYPPGREFNKLKNLRSKSYTIIFASFILSLSLSYLISTRMSQSVKKLYNAAIEIKNNNYNVDVDIKKDDEFGLLGKSFNQMANAIEKTTSELETSNERLRSITADMHDGVGSVLASIHIASSNNNLSDMHNIQNLAKQGLNEVRFLMDALEYQYSDIDILIDGIELLAIDILKPNGVQWSINNSIINFEIPFQVYLDIQRMIREIFTNIIKHSSAETCTMKFDLINDTLQLKISDNGEELSEKIIESSGRGINNIRHRASKYFGNVSTNQTDFGFHYKITLKIPK